MKSAKTSELDPIAYIARQSGYSRQLRFEKRCEFLFKGMDLEGKRVIDVGCGTGKLGLWTAVKGAASVLGIEPESEGSTSGTLERFRQTVEHLGLSKSVEARACFLQDIKPNEGPFDVAILYNVINHLNESMVMRLHKDANAVDEYVKLLKEFRQILAKDAYVIIADCSRNNFWNDVGLKNPFMPSIEWEKHQAPRTWKMVFENAGFRLQDLRWSKVHPFGFLSGNRFAHYMTLSHFVMRFRAT